MDLSQVPTEELLKAAGTSQAPTPDLSGVSNDDLMKAAGVTPPSPMNSLQDYGKSVYGWNDYPVRATFLPMAEDNEGNAHFAMPQIGVDALNSILLPGFAAKGGQYTYGDTLGLAGMASPLSAGARAGEYAPALLAPGAKTVKPKVPTTEELKTAASTGYDTARDMGVTYPSPSVKNMADDIANSLNEEGRIGELNPELFALIGKLQNPPSGSYVTLDSLQALRRRFGDIAGSPDRAKSAAASIAIDKLDNFLDRSAPRDGALGNTAGAEGYSADAAVAGPAAAQGGPFPGGVGGVSGEGAPDQAAQILKEARGNSAAAFRSDRVADLEDATDLRASASNSGHNLGNTIRQRLASLLLSPQKTRGFSDDELDAARQIVQGTTATNTLREVSNHLGGGGGLGHSLIGAIGAGTGVAMGGGLEGAALGATVPTIVGSGARSLGNLLTNNQLVKLQELLRKRSPLYQARIDNPQTAPTATIPGVLGETARRLAMVRALQGYGQNTGMVLPNTDNSPSM